MAKTRTLPSEQVIIQAPMSYTGSRRRIVRRVTRHTRLALPVAVPVVAAAWLVVTAWYVVFGVLVIPWRLIRRGHRMERRDQLRHREAIARPSSP
ncbi:MAG: hypothetical protein SHS37scaffold145_59 [Phage 71_18]|nr:MAG: hypothetical protein SHS37scaffold145_59 [Phage 71_18]